MTKNLYDNNLKGVAGGQQFAENVMGVEGLCACTGKPTSNNKEGIFFTKHGIYLNKWEVMEMLKNKATRDLDQKNEGFIQSYIDSYNSSEQGEIIMTFDKG